MCLNVITTRVTLKRKTPTHITHQEMESEPLDEVQWRSPEWIQQNNGLRTDNVLEYFSYSPFYDRGSNNQILKMQSQFQQPPPTAAAPGVPPHQAAQQQQQQLYAELRNMKGTEFVVAIAREPDLWIIRKQTRLSPQETRPLATYFVVGENIYMAPSVHSVVTSRLLSTTQALTKALAKASRLHGFSPSQGYFYKNDLAGTGYSSTAAAAAGSSGSSSTNNNNGGSAGRTVSRQVTPGTTPAASSTTGSGAGTHASTALLTTNMERIAFSAIDRALNFTMGGTPAYIDDVPDASAGGNGVNAAAATATGPAAVAAASGAGGGPGTGVNTAVGTPVSTPASAITTTKANPKRRKKLHG